MIPTSKRIMSAVQPTGELHLGNYLGAVRHWVPLQDANEVYYCVADLHTLTVPHDPALLAANTLKTALLYVAAGIDPAKATLFVQSHLSQHAELAWLLTCLAPLNWLEGMTQFKTKGEESGSASAGLLTYPALMAADILLYQAQLVPVGHDQMQHLELARSLAKRFNHTYKETFTVPQALPLASGARIMSLSDGLAKMSKSAPDASRINLLDPPATITKKLKRAKSDLIASIYRDEQRPEANNLLTIYELVSGQTPEAVAAEAQALNWGGFKQRLSEATVAYLAPIQARYAELSQDTEQVKSWLRQGAQDARIVAQASLQLARSRVGLSSF